MKASVYKEYGTPDVLKIHDIEKPVPGKDEILIRVCATSVFDMLLPYLTWSGHTLQ